MAKVIMVTRLGIKHPMILCPITNMGIVFDRDEFCWNQDIEKPTFNKVRKLGTSDIAFTVDNGFVRYSKNSQCVYSEKSVALKDWNDKTTAEEGIFFRINRAGLGLALKGAL